jgi:ribosomal protein S18 acetylase RimI-like enzyme
MLYVRPNREIVLHVDKDHKLIRQGDKYFLTNGSQLVAKVHLESSIKSSDAYYMCNFLVPRRLRGKWYGDMMMGAIVTLCKSRKKSIYLYVRQDNAVAIKIYKKYGFQFHFNNADQWYATRSHERNML